MSTCIIYYDLFYLYVFISKITVLLEFNVLFIDVMILKLNKTNG